MHIHILGICGTFMGGIAILAREQGHRVSGSDHNVYPPMSTLLADSGIDIREGYSPAHLEPGPDLVIIGNTLGRGNECVEFTLESGLSYTSGPQWLLENILHGRQVIAISGTHGKTTTTSMVAWILESAGIKAGFLVGGVAENFGISARSGTAGCFVVEADEYDSAFFDKRSKFIHYHPDILVINNIEFDHADIFDDINAIRRQFHHLLKTVPRNGCVIARDADPEIDRVLEMGCWTPVQGFGLESGTWSVSEPNRDYSSFTVMQQGNPVGRVNWSLLGTHNAENALAAVSAAAAAGVDPVLACNSLAAFKSVKRRLQQLAVVEGITVYDDFAHHPTAIRVTLQGLRCKVGNARIIAVLEPRSNTMKMGVHRDTLAPALADADHVLLYQGPQVRWDLSTVTGQLGGKGASHDSIQGIINSVCAYARPGDHVVIMSNGGFESIHSRLIDALKARA